MSEELTKEDLEKVNSIEFDDVNTADDLAPKKESNEESVNDRATRSIISNIDIGEIERTHSQIETIFAQVSEKYINPYYDTVDKCKVFRQAAEDIGIKSDFQSFDEADMKRLMDELTGSMDLIKTKSDEILENVSGLEMLGKDYKGSSKIPLEETRKLNEAFALTEDLSIITRKIEDCMQEDDESITPISELYDKQISGVKAAFVEKLNETITNLITDSKIKNFKIKQKLILQEKVSPIEWMMGKHRLKAAQILNYDLLAERAEVLRNEDLGARNIGESVLKLYDYISTIPDKYYTQGIANLIDELSKSESCRKLIRQAKQEKAKQQEEQRKRYELGEEIDSEEEKDSEEKSQKQLEREFSENALIKVSKQEKFFKPYRKETEKLQERNEELKREIANLRKIFGKNKKDAKTYMRESANKENQEKIISRIKNVISCLYSETPTKKRAKATQLREDSER
jgi:hypothetical protein